jgi:ribonucleoside-diphosphate reductase alpha chain
VEAELNASGFDDVARAYIIYRQRRAELRAAKELLGVRDDLKLSLAAVTVLRERYLRRDQRGRPTESTGQMMDRVANCVAAAEDGYWPGSSGQWVERFATLLRSLEFLPNSPTLMNAGTDLGLLAGCFVLPVEDSLQSIFTTLGQAAEIQRTGGGTGYAFTHLRPAGDRIASTGGTASGPLSFIRLYDTAAGVVSMGRPSPGREHGGAGPTARPSACAFGKPGLAASSRRASRSRVAGRRCRRPVMSSRRAPVPPRPQGYAATRSPHPSGGSSGRSPD